MSNRTITVFSTKGKQKAKIESNVTSWGELKPLIESEGYDLHNLQAIDNMNHAILAHPDAKLPERDFIVFLKPVKTKSGATDYSTASYGEMKKALTDSDKAALLAEHGKNWTKCGTEDYRNQLMGNSYVAPSVTKKVKKTKTTTTTTKTTPKAKAPKKEEAPAVEEVEEEIIVVPAKKDNETKAEKKARKAAKKARKEQKARMKADREETEALSKTATETFSKVK